MSFKASITHTAKRTNEFPAFYVLKGDRGGTQYILLVTGKNENELVGTVITQGGNKVGQHSEHWDGSQFERLNGTFTITQD